MALFLNILIGPLSPALPITGQGPDTTALAAPGDVVVTQADDASGCMGVVTTPGSENTDKQLLSGNLEPGGTATFLITFPVDADDVGGDFRITDCVFIDTDGDGDTEEGEAVAKYFIDFVPNFEDFELTFTLNIPADAPIGDEYCNFAKTTESPSNSQASNRKAGPACFIIGGAIRVSKVDQLGAPLPGATFSVVCTYPTTTSALAATVIGAPTNGSVTDGNDGNATNDPTESYASTSGGVLSVTVVTGSDGVISVNAPVGTSCVFTETAAPGGYLPPARPNNTVTLVVPPSGSDAVTHTFTNTRIMPDVIVGKSASQSTVLAPYSGLVYTLTASNTGNGQATGVIVTDNLDDDLTVVSATFDNDPGTAGGTGNCTVGAGNMISCSVGNLAASDGNTTGAEPDVATVTITVNVPVAACPSITNTSSVSATNEEAGQQGNNSSNTVTVTVNCPDASVVKTATDPTIIGGDAAEFSITANGGTLGTASDVILTDTLPSGFTWTVGGADIGDCTAGGPALVAGDTLAGGTLLTCNFGPLAVNETKTITLSATTTLEACEATISNTAQISVAGDTAAANNSSTATITVECPDASIVKDAVDATIAAGEEASFTVVVTAGGSGPSNNVVLTDENPADSGRTWTVSGDDAAACGTGDDLIVVPGETLTCDFGDVPNGETRTITITTSSSTADCADGIANTAEITADDDVDESNNSDSASITVVCPPNLDVVKSAADDVVDAGQPIGFSIDVSNSAAPGTGTAVDVTIEDLLPFGPGIDWDVASVWLNGVEVGDPETYCSIDGTPPAETLNCDFGDFEPGDSATVNVSSGTNAASCETYENVATVDATNHAALDSEPASVTVECPGLNLDKAADSGPIVAGDEASFTITVWNAGPGDALGVTLDEDLPAGLTWDFEIVSGDATADDCSVASSLVLGGEEQMSVHCEFGTLGVTDMAGGIVIRFFATTDRTDCGELENSATADATNNPGEPLTRTASIVVRCPTLVIDKAADAELITITGPNNALVATPSVVTWTLSWTLTDGPVTNAVISDEIPVGFEFLDASDGGTLVDGEVVWTFDELTESGSVTFRTTVDPETISRVAPTVNVAVISSDQTPEDEGQDSVTVTREEELGGNPTPRPSLPNTAAGIGLNGEPITVPIELLAAFFIGSLGALALANVKARNRRR